MATDTRNKRASLVGFRTGGLLVVEPNPDGSLANENDRAQMQGLYAATLSAAQSQRYYAEKAQVI